MMHATGAGASATAGQPDSPAPILLGSYAARSCPVKTQHAFDPTVAPETCQPAENLPELFEGGQQFEQSVLDAWAGRPGVVDLRGLTGQPWAVTSAACLAAMAGGAPVILGGRLPADPQGGRIGSPAALARGDDRPDGRPSYHPVQLKWHKIADQHRLRDGQPEPRALSYTTLDAPSPGCRRQLPGYGLRIGRREADFLELAHYHRMLAAADFAGAALAAVIGTDPLPPEPVLAWVDLDEPRVRTFSRSQPEGWRLRSLLERYDHEHEFRRKVAAVARQQTGDAARDPRLLVTPIRVPECGRCQWWQRCRPQLHPDDVSLRIDSGRLDAREIAVLRSHGVATITDLAGADVTSLLDWYLPEVTHREGAEARLRLAIRRAQMLAVGAAFSRETTGAIPVPGAELEVDFDIESAADGRVYLWGFAISDRSRPGASTYRHFSRFADLDAAGEAELAREALGWLREMVEGAREVLVYHYSGYEVAMIKELAHRTSDPVLGWAADYASGSFVDLLDVVKQHFFGVAGLGLKQVAKEAGFSWRDDDPGGLNSQRWFLEAVRGETPELREAARQRVLEYNEDDVIATREVRRWLRAQ